MNNPPFCPSDHLMLGQPTCPTCGWQPPPPIPQGAFLWDPVFFACGLGGPPQESFIRPGIVRGTAVFPLRSGELAALDQRNGHILWRSEPTPEQYPRHLHLDESGGLLAVVADNRPIDRAGNGCLVSIDPRSGKQEKLWEGYGYTMTEPVFAGSKFYVRTARPRLVAFNLRDPAKPAWEVALKTYKPVSLAADSQFVFAWDGEVTKETLQLKAFSAENGKLVWQAATAEIDTPPLVVDNQLIHRNNKCVLTSLNTADGSQLWQRKFAKMYSPPVYANGKLYLIVCGAEKVESPEYYSLSCLNTDTGETEWQVPLGIRAQEIIPLPDGNLLIGMGDPTLVICSSRDGSIQWQHCFGGERVNRVQSHLVVADGICLLGTYEGFACAIRVTADAPVLAAPKDYLEEEDYDSAAQAYVSQGKWVKAAELYLDKLGQPRKALSIYEHVKDIPGQARALEDLGDELGAARLLQKSGKLAEAAVLFERVNELRTAMNLYRELKDTVNFFRLRALVPYEFSDIEQLEKEKKFVEAGDTAIRLGDYRKAVDLFTQAGVGERTRLLDALVHLCETNPEHWALDQTADLARQLGRFDIRGKALEKRGVIEQAAYAYLLAAQQMEERSPNKTEEIAVLYETAHRHYEQEGMLEQQHQCWRKVLQYRKLPWILVTGESEKGKAFRECEFNTLTLEVKNIGFGRADNIEVKIQSNRFEIDQNSIPGPIRVLGAQNKEVIYLPIRPLEDQVGEGVPFTLAWHWQDRSGKEFNSKTNVSVSVKKQDEARTGGTPVIIRADHYYAGDDYHKDIRGDVIEAGGQKGDKAEVNNFGITRVVDSEYGELTPANLLKKCPVCSLPIDKDDEFCDFCGTKLK
ncbi:MAG TPA: PQQ-binding-like beta-propeller repeat protein [Anaerolineaceae bacterium]|nr:PQQ-binding-like beta-propeller repeat protein [Anaerolineaceae bacterium]